MSVPHLVQYQGSKRLLAPQILQFMPQKFSRLIEPFAGMEAVSIAAACENRNDRFLINDINAPLISLLRAAVENPEKLIDSYTSLWHEQFAFAAGHINHYYAVRERFSQGDQSPENMLYLLARCVKDSVRYGKSGNFN